jgi:hypothetical protein
VYPAFRRDDETQDQARRDKARVPEAIAAGLPRGVVLMDAGYGNDTGRRAEIGALGLRCVAGIGSPSPRQQTTTQAASARRGASTALGKGPRSRASRLKPGTPLRGARVAPTGTLRASHSSGCDRRIAVPS